MNASQFEDRLKSHYSAVRSRVAYPRKPIIAVPESTRKIEAPIVARHCEDTNPHGRRYAYSRQKLKELFESGLTFVAIGEALGVTATAVRKCIRKQGWTR